MKHLQIKIGRYMSILEKVGHSLTSSIYNGTLFWNILRLIKIINQFINLQVSVNAPSSGSTRNYMVHLHFCSCIEKKYALFQIWRLNKKYDLHISSDIIHSRTVPNILISYSSYIRGCSVLLWAKLGETFAFRPLFLVVLSSLTFKTLFYNYDTTSF